MRTEICREYDFSVVPTVLAFVNCNAFIKAIRGPYGSGKSSGCVMDLLRRTCQQQPDGNNIRKTRWAVIRNSYRQLKDTTKKTIEEWLPFALWKESESCFILDFRLEDGTIVYSEWLLRALDRPDQVSNLFSLDLTGAWLNEARELPKEVFDNIQYRVGRYPRRYKDYGPTWYGVILDTNPPDVDHWFYHFFEEINHDPEKVAIFAQPSGRSEEAENLPNLPPDYYTSKMLGKDEEFIRVFIDGEYGYLKEGRPVFPNFKDSVHVHNEILKPIQGVPIIIGLDCGLAPAAVFTQMDSRGRLLVIDEIKGEYMSAREFALQYLRPTILANYMSFDYKIVGDPAGGYKSQIDKRTVYQELRACGLKAVAAKTNSLQARIGAVNLFLTRMVEGKPAFLLSPKCTNLRKALNGAYKFRRLRVSDERYADEPDKGEYSHIAEALQYACLEYETCLVGSKRPFIERYIEPNKDIPYLAWV